MKTYLRSAMIAAALLGGVGYAQAQAVSTTIELTPTQRSTVYSTITRERVRVAPPADFRARVGVVVPEAVELYEMPTAVEVPAVRSYRYTVIDNDVVLVDPGSRRVMQIISE